MLCCALDDELILESGADGGWVSSGPFSPVRSITPGCAGLRKSRPSPGNLNVGGVGMLGLGSELETEPEDVEADGGAGLDEVVRFR